MKLTNQVTGTVTSDGTTPLSGVTVTASPGTVPAATTNSAGAFKFSALPVGSYQMTFHLAGYVDQTVPVSVNLSGPTNVSVVLVFNLDGAVGPSVSVSDQLEVGFSAPITVTATATGTGTLTYKWTQTGGAPVTFTGGSTDTISFTTNDFVSSLGYAYPDGITGGGIELTNARCGVRGIDRDQANHSAFQVVVTDGNGVSTTSSVTVYSTRPTTGLRNVPMGIPVWLQGNGPDIRLDGGALQATWTWQLTAKPAGSTAATLYAANGPASTAYAGGASGQFAYFIPDVIGTYTVSEATSGCSFNVYAGTWMGIMTVTGPSDSPVVQSTAQSGVCAGNCHYAGGPAPDMFTPWEGTNHATALKRKIEGSAGSHFGESCLECHTLGYDKSVTATNGGFDDLEGPSGWTYPATNTAGNWSALENVQTPTDLADRAGIQCENCHGPQGNVSNTVHGLTAVDSKARISWSEEVCASCHEEYGNHYKPSQWTQQGPSGPGGHSNRQLAIQEGGGGSDHCARCHSAQGYARYSANLPGGYYGYLTNDGKPLDPTYPALTATNTPATAAQLGVFGMNPMDVEPQTCQACHDPHSAANPNQLRVYDGVPELPNGLTNISGMGNGMVCATCHNSRNGEHTDILTNITQSVNTGTAAAPVWTSTGKMVPGPLASFTTPHTPSQTDVYFGFNTYFGARTTPSAHMAVADSCAGCHYAAPTAAETALKETTNHSFVVDSTICKNCHAAAVDGVSLQAANRMALDGLRNLWASKLITNLNNAITATAVTATAYDPSTGHYGTGKTPAGVTYGAVTPITAVTAISWANIGTANGQPSYGGFSVTAGLTLTLATPATVQWYDANGNAVGTPAPIANLTVPLSSLATGVAIPNTGGTSGNKAAKFSAMTGAVEWTTSGPVAELPPWVNGDIQTLIKAYWNLTLLSYDNTLGIHNPTFFNDVVSNTTVKLEGVL